MNIIAPGALEIGLAGACKSNASLSLLGEVE